MRKWIIEFIDKRPGLSFILFVISLIVIFILCNDFNQEYDEKEYQAAKSKILAEIDNQTLCEELYDACIYYEENSAIEQMNEFEYTVYVLYNFDKIVSNEGIGMYLYDTDCLFIDEISNELRIIGMEEMANYYEEFFSHNRVNYDDFMADAKEPEELYKYSYVDSLYRIYPLDDFDKRYAELNDEELLINNLAIYARLNIDEFSYSGISAEKLQMELWL